MSTPTVDVVRGVFGAIWGKGEQQVLPDQPNPAFRYLRVDVEGRPPVLMVLGYIDKGPWGDIDVWYSASREVLRTSSGRLVGTAGLELDWRDVRYPTQPPDWAQVAQLELGVVNLPRIRDVMPGYRYGVAEQLSLTSVPRQPAWARPNRLPVKVVWAVETATPTASTGAEVLPGSAYAIAEVDGRSQVVYSRQCLRADFCLHLQPWPVPGVQP